RDYLRKLLKDIKLFFSSRRQHTRWPRDWSSDVCSSDLGPPRRGAPLTSDQTFDFQLLKILVAALLFEGDLQYDRQPDNSYAVRRSEERRVGKVCIFVLSF